MTDIEQMMRTLKLGGLAKEWKSVEYHDTEQYVTELLKIELHEREVNRINRMVRIAGFHVIKTLDDFEWRPEMELPAGKGKPDISWCSWNRQNTSCNSDCSESLSGRA